MFKAFLSLLGAIIAISTTRKWQMFTPPADNLYGLPSYRHSQSLLQGTPSSHVCTTTSCPDCSGISSKEDKSILLVQAHEARTTS